VWLSSSPTPSRHQVVSVFLRGPDWGDKVDYGIGLSYRPVRLHKWRAGTTALCHSRPYPPARDYEFGYCVSPVELSDGRQERRGGGGAKLYDGEKALSSINHSILSDVQHRDIINTSIPPLPWSQWRAKLPTLPICTSMILGWNKCHKIFLTRWNFRGPIRVDGGKNPFCA
jgi:hypothetical protein